MHMRSNIIIQIFLFTVMLLGISACGKTPAARFYTLSSMSSQGAADHASKEGKTIIGIGPVNIAAYLDRSEIVTRSSPTTIELASFNRWAEPFKDIVASALAENISNLLPSVQAIVDPWPEADIDYRIVLKVIKFESDNNGNIKLNASWGIVHRSNSKLNTVYDSKITLSGTSTDFDAITSNMSLALVKLSEEIVTEIKKIK